MNPDRGRDWQAVFEELSVASSEAVGGQVYSVSAIVDSLLWLGKDELSRPAFLVAPASPAVGPAIAVDLPNFRAQHHCDVSLVGRDGVARPETLSILTCLSCKPDLHKLFIAAVGHALPAEPSQIDQSELERLVQHLMELFRASEAPATGTVVGLWGELFVIKHARNATEWLSAWHAEPSERFDFATSLERVEVKTTLSEVRRHVVSLEQLADVPARPGYVISIQTVESAGGASLAELWDAASSGAGSPELQAKLDLQVITTLGRDWSIALDRQFDHTLATDSLAVFRCADIPSLSGVPREVSSVHFTVDLTAVRARTGTFEDPESLLSGLPDS